jgi:hypothetical protein
VKKIALLIGCTLLLACTKKETPEVDPLGFDYYPLQIGRFVTYQVDSTLFIEIPKDTITYSYQLKERIADTFTEQDGAEAYRLERFARYKNSNGSFTEWHLVDVWLVRASNKKIEQQESNLRYTRLRFPVELNATWNGNAANNKPAQDFSYTSVDKAELVGDQSFESVLQVTEIDNVNLIEAEQANKRYAKGVGLISADYKNVKGNTIVPGTTVFQRIESGLIYKQEIITYGVD